MPLLPSRLAAAGALLIIAAGASAQSPGLLEAAVDRHQSVSLHNWRFDRVREVDGLEVRERCVGIDFKKAECRLRLVGGEPPDEKAQKRYADNVQQPVEGNLPNIDLTEYIDFASVRGTDQDSATARYAFDSPPGDEDDAMADAKPSGKATVDREEGYVTQFGIHNSGPFKPATGVKIKTFKLDFNFIEVDDVVFATRVSMQVKGRAFGLKKIEQTETFRFENFVAPY